MSGTPIKDINIKIVTCKGSKCVLPFPINPHHSKI